jgi:hypothetical protein
MRVKCLKNNCTWLTIGKIYDVIKEDEFCYWITDDIGRYDWYPMNLFKSLSEIRNEKINKLLDE